MARGSRRAAWVVVGVAVVAGWSAPAALAELTSPLAFGAGVRADVRGLSSMSCPSARLCVATDASGRLASSVRPIGGAARWRTQTVSGSAGTLELTQVSCASTRLCVAIARDDEVATSTDPGTAMPAWSVTHVNQPNPAVSQDLAGIACPTTSLCVITDQEGDVITSTDPSSSLPAWMVSRVDHGTTYECVHYDQVGCAPDLGPISCPSSTRCVALDFEGNELSSADPAGGPSAWSVIGGGYDTPSTFWGYLTCAPSLCLTAQFADPGIYAQLLTETRPALPGFRVGEEVSALACPSASLCLAGNSVDTGAARVYVSAAPRSGAWRPVYSAAPGVTGGSTISAISCPSTRLCFVADSTGRVTVGTPSPSRTQLTTALHELIQLHGSRASIGHILHQHGEREAIIAPLTGTLTIAWQRSDATGARPSSQTGSVVAYATTRLVKRQRAIVVVKLTAAGRRLLSHATRGVTLVARARLAPTSQPPIMVTNRITLRAR